MKTMKLSLEVSKRPGSDYDVEAIDLLDAVKAIEPLIRLGGTAGKTPFGVGCATYCATWSVE